MMDKIHRRLHSDEGFTLVELMVVVLIIAILMAIAIPTFLGARQKAQDRAAQSNLRNALTAAKVWYVDGETYVATGAQLNALEPSLSFDDTIANASATVIGFTGTASTIVMETQSASGAWFCISDDTSGGGTDYGKTSTTGAKADLDTFAECTGGW
jgi:type IV pilus assembly protein PilA